MCVRSSVRVKQRTPVGVEIGRPGQPAALGVVANISDQGACVVTDSSFPIGESLVLQLVFAPDVQPFQAAGRVVWMRNRGGAPGALRYGLPWAHRTGPRPSRLRELITDKI